MKGFALIEIREISRVSENLKFSCSEDLANYCMGKPLELNTLAEERFYVFCVDIKNRVKSIEMLSKGSLTSSIVHPREVLKAAILSNAASVVFVHNHPSGDPDPSVDDIEITNRLSRACDICGIAVLDHIIIGKKDWFSFKRKMML